MSSVHKYGGQEGWSNWVNSDSTERAPRIVGTDMKLPFQRIPHLGIGDLVAVAPGTNQLLSRWSFGERGNLWGTLNVDLANDDDSLDPGSGLHVAAGGNIQHVLGVPSAVSSIVERSEFGMNIKTRGGYAAVVNQLGDVGSEIIDHDSPDAQPTYMSCWVKSNITDYSSRLGIIVAYYSKTIFADGVNRLLHYSFVVDTDNKFKVYMTSDVTKLLIEIPPVGGDVSVDTNWHHLLLAMGKSLANGSIFIIDNNWGIGPVTGSHDVDIAPSAGDDAFLHLSIGSSEMSGETLYGFSGLIDEVVIADWTASDVEIGGFNPHTHLGAFIGANSGTLEPEDIFGSSYSLSHRFEPTIFLSPVMDTERPDSRLSSILTTFTSPNGSSIRFSFRASDALFGQADTNIEWTGFTAPNRIPSGSMKDLSDLGLYVRGRYQQVRIRMAPSNVNSPTPDDLRTDTPIISALQINTGVSVKLLAPSNPAYEPGTIRAQVVNFAGSRTIHKVSLNLTVVSADRKEFVVGQAGSISFQAANFQDGRDTWAFQPVINWNVPSWTSSGTTIQNTFQQDSYTTEVDVTINAPFLQYRVFFSSGGTYDLWGYGYTQESEAAYWAFDSDDSHLRPLVLGDDSSGWESVPKWTKFGTFYVEEGGIHTFEVYLGTANTVLLDQWYFTTNLNTESVLTDAGLDVPLPLSKAPFNTAVRLRSLAGELDDLASPSSGSSSVTAWLSSNQILASGKFNYEAREVSSDEYGAASAQSGITFDDGLSIEYWQIGGGTDFFAAWDYTFPTNSAGATLTSTNNGQTFTND